MAYTIYTGTFEQGRNTLLRLTANPYYIITTTTKDGSQIDPITGTTISPTSSDCINYNDGVTSASYNLGKLSSVSSTVNVTTAPYSFDITYHNYGGPSSSATDTQRQYYGIQFNLKSVSTSVTGYKFKGWAVGTSYSTIIIPAGVSTAVLCEIDNISDAPANLKIPSLYTTPSTTLHLYALWRPCSAVTINVKVTDGSPITSTITVND